MRGPAVSNPLPLARTSVEAHLFLQLQPCPQCGEARCRFRSSVVSIDDTLASRYTGTCARCGTERSYQFRLPDQLLPPPADTVRFGGDEPSQLIDPGVWMWYSENTAKQVPADPTGPDDPQRRTARHALATALGAIAEVLKFIPPHESAVPAAAFTSLDGRAMYDHEPGRFTRERLQVVRDTYAELLARW